MQPDSTQQKLIDDNAAAISLEVEVLEDRIAPMMLLIVAEAAAGSGSRGVSLPCDCFGSPA